MAAAIDIKKVGGTAAVTISGDAGNNGTHYVPVASVRSGLKYNDDDDTINVNLNAEVFYNALPIADVSFDGDAVTDKEDFEAKLAEVFPDAGGAAIKTFVGSFTTTDESNQTSGVLIVGKIYQITNYISVDDFKNVGAESNNEGVIFTATGTTPDNWSNESVITLLSELEVVEIKNTLAGTGDITFPRLDAGRYYIHKTGAFSGRVPTFKRFSGNHQFGDFSTN